MNVKTKLLSNFGFVEQCKKYKLDFSLLHVCFDPRLELLFVPCLSRLVGPNGPTLDFNLPP